ncbi:hypothetical protein BS47DRAFT_1366329 [Hydnum rufescens UP504]|uniref:Uncharacterized protein n=1 Tax=Hydnum rufescens UP504 TaxID=1448309 RepID=A0A9P6ALP4_9AGAM|nr:hypothetical protein BS47DRAFT_1366329 [Hydnum rufescens UP504]
MSGSCIVKQASDDGQEPDRHVTPLPGGYQYGMSLGTLTFPKPQVRSNQNETQILDDGLARQGVGQARHSQNRIEILHSGLTRRGVEQARGHQNGVEIPHNGLTRQGAEWARVSQNRMEILGNGLTMQERLRGSQNRIEILDNGLTGQGVEQVQCRTLDIETGKV